MKNLAELQALKENLQEKNNAYSTRILIGMATCGIAAGARPILSVFEEAVKSNGLNDVLVTQVGCNGLCQFEPLVEIVKNDGTVVTYVNLDEDKAKEIAEKHLVGGNVVEEYTVGSTTLS